MNQSGPQLEPYLDERTRACAECGYDLHGTIVASGTTCPECGTAFRLMVVVTRLGVVAWYLMVVATSMLFGGSGLYLVYVYLRGYRSFVKDMEVYPMMVACPLAFAAIIVLGWKREWIVRRPRVAVWLVATLYSLCIFGFLVLWVTAFLFSLPR